MAGGELFVSTAVPPVVGDTSLIAALHIPRDRQIGALWRRLVAFALDSLFLGLAASVLVWPFFKMLSHLGTWAPLLGFFIGLPYFALMNSRVGNGQTWGKRLLHLQVVYRDGETLSLSDSTLRYSVFSIGYYLSSIALPATRTPWIVMVLLPALTGGLCICIVYLVLFNRRSRQGVHDLAVDSFVADAHPNGPLMPKPIWKAHWLILGAILLVIFVGGGILESRMRNLKSFSELLADLEIVEGMRGVYAASVMDANAWGSGNSKKLIIVTVHWTGDSDQQGVFSEELVRTLLLNDPKIDQWGALRVVVVRGYNIGVANANVSQVFQHTPAEWRDLLDSTTPRDPLSQ
jgi:uncharacterized RDD family membrane protein YckC